MGSREKVRGKERMLGAAPSLSPLVWRISRRDQPDGFLSRSRHKKEVVSSRRQLTSSQEKTLAPAQRKEREERKRWRLRSVFSLFQGAPVSKERRLLRRP